MRLDWTFSPNLSLQLYAAPYIASYNYTALKEFRSPGTFDFDLYGEQVGSLETNADGSSVIDPDGAGPSPAFTLPKLDFNFRSIRVNTVLRWEYRPGSVLFFVWQQERDDFAQRNGLLDFSRDYDALFHVRPVNTFLIKASYWLGF